jgi:hypothetical protein
MRPLIESLFVETKPKPKPTITKPIKEKKDERTSNNNTVKFKDNQVDSLTKKEKTALRIERENSKPIPKQTIRTKKS